MGMSSLIAPVHYFEKGASLNLELAISAALASQELPGCLHLLPDQHWAPESEFRSSRFSS